MVKFVLPRRASAHTQTKGYRCGNHARSIERARWPRPRVPAFKILIESDSVKFDENSRLIRI
jgi:hypothetical protein